MIGLQKEYEQDDRLIRLQKEYEQKEYEQKEYEQKEYELQECRKELMKKKLIENYLCIQVINNSKIKFIFY